MQDNEQLFQRLIDGALNAPEASAVERAVRDDERQAERLLALRALHTDLAGVARPMTRDDHHDLHARICQKLPHTRPQTHARIRPIDLVLAGAALVLVVMSFTLFGSMLHGSLMVLALACVSFVGGALVLILAGMLRRLEAGLLARLLGRPISIGPADLLVYRAIGIGLAIGGIYLTRLC